MPEPQADKAMTPKELTELDLEQPEKRIPPRFFKMKHIAVEDIRRLRSLSFVIRKGLSPINSLMKAFGLTYGSSCPLDTYIGIKHKIQRAYTITVAAFMLVALLRLIPSLVKEISYRKFVQYEYVLMHFKCIIQAYFCFFISSRYGRKLSRFQELVHEYDLQLDRYKATYDPKIKRKFQRNSKIMFYVLVTASATMFLSFILNVFLPVFYDNMLGNGIFAPFAKPSLAIKLLYVVGYLYLIVAWLLPVILYCSLCLSLCLIFDQFSASLAAGECHKISKRIHYIREEYQRLERLVNRTDDIIGFMAFCVYLMDVVLCCFHTYHLVFHAKNFWQGIAPAYRVVVSIANLYFTSQCASMVVEKGQRISTYVARMSAENVDLESHAQLVMLLHEITINPIALTVWKLIPLYKSIVISVFVSLVTYFTLLIQFKG